MGALTVQQMAERVSGLLEERLKARGAGLDARLRHAGRKLPRKVRQAATRLSAAQARSAVPKLMVQVDESAVARDYDLCLRHLTSLAPPGGLVATLLQVGSVVAVGLLVLAMAIGGFVLWQGGV